MKKLTIVVIFYAFVTIILFSLTSCKAKKTIVEKSVKIEQKEELKKSVEVENVSKNDIKIDENTSINAYSNATADSVVIDENKKVIKIYGQKTEKRKKKVVGKQITDKTKTEEKAKISEEINHDMQIIQNDKITEKTKQKEPIWLYVSISVVVLFGFIYLINRILK